MIFGNYIINAEQAREITNKAREIMEVIDEQASLKQAETELEVIYKQISGAASRGEMSTDVFIMYKSTYDNLADHGFELHGGVIREFLPKNMWNTFGGPQDLFCIEWGEENAK